MKQKLTEWKGEIYSSTIIGDLNTPHSIMSRTTRQINKRTDDVKNTINQFHLTYIQRILNNSRIYIVLKCTQYILQDGPHARPENKFY